MDRIITLLVGVVIAGGPMVFFIWHQISEALLGRPDWAMLTLAAALLVVLLAMLAFVGRTILRLEEREG